MNARDFEKEIKIHIESRYPVLWLVSFEERRVEKILEDMCRTTNFKFWSWSVSRGMYSAEKKKWEPLGREKVLTAIEERIQRAERTTISFY